MQHLIVTSKLTELNHVLDFVYHFLNKCNCPPELTIKIAVTVEEIYTNIASYAYIPKEGEVEIQCKAEDNAATVVIVFIDSGYPYNPLERNDPDISLSTEERKIGGLGIYMVKKSMDEVKYEYKDKKNIFTMKKKIKD